LRRCGQLSPWGARLNSPAGTLNERDLASEVLAAKSAIRMKKLILIDDDADARLLLEQLLRFSGYGVHSAADMSLADEGTEPADAIVIDCNLEGSRSGTELLREIRSGRTERSPAIPVILISGDGRRREESLQAGADAFLEKPFSSSELIDLIELQFE